MSKHVQTIGVLTSGGDAPGMNAAMRAVVREALFKGLKVKGISRGYAGLLNEDIFDMTASDVSETISKGGTKLQTARCTEFVDPDVQKMAAEICKKHGIDALVVIGGDGTMLRSAHTALRLDIPITGIDAGCAGYYARIKENEIEETEESSQNFTNVLGNDDEIVEEKSETAKVDYKEELSTRTVDKLKEKSAQEEASKIQEKDSIKDILDDENIPNIEDSLNINEDESFLSKEDEKNISEIIETVEKNPRITLWSAKSAAVLRYLRKTQPEFSISKEASRLIDEAIAEEYPEIWTLFNHL